MLRLNLYNNHPSSSKIIIKAKIHGNAENYKGRALIITTDILIFDVYTPGGSPVQRWKPQVDCLQPHL